MAFLCACKPPLYFSPKQKIVITGFNTDIEHGGVIYHVQTEDKGVSTPLILSLVYNRGTILASKRSPYDDLLLPAFDEKALSERLQKQHKLICAAVRAGRLEDLKRMGKQPAAPKQKDNGAPAPAEIVAEKPQSSPANKFQKPESEPRKPSISPPPQPKQQPKVEAPLEQPPLQIAKQKNPVEIQAKQRAPDLPKPATIRIETEAAKPKEVLVRESLVLDVPLSIVEEEPIIEGVAIVEEETILAAEAVAVIADETENFQAADNKLQIRLPDDVTFRSGERKTVNISVCRGEKQMVSSGAHIMIKVFGAAFRPLIFHAKTDDKGAATVHLQMPQFKGGRAAILIRAMSDGDEAELRRTIEQN